MQEVPSGFTEMDSIFVNDECCLTPSACSFLPLPATVVTVNDPSCLKESRFSR